MKILNNKAIILFCILFSSNPLLLAENNEYKWTVGGSLATFNTSLLINSMANNENRFIDLEDDLGYDDSVNFSLLNFEALFSKKHRLSVSISPVSRSSQFIIDESIDFGDDTLLIDTDIESKVTNTTYDIRYGYRFRTSEKVEFEAIFGIYWMSTKFDLDASGFIENAVGDIEFDSNYQKKRSADIPLPLLGIGYRYYMNKQWTIIGSATYFSSSYNDADGSVSSFFIATEYTPGKNWGVGASVSYLDVDVGLTKTDYAGRVNWQYTGLNAYVFYKF